MDVEEDVIRMKIIENNNLLNIKNIDKKYDLVEISIIVIVNDKNIFKECLIYLEKQTMAEKTELIAIDNLNNNFHCAAEALNYGLTIAKGEYIVFMHQDMMLTDCNSLKKYCDFLNENTQSIVGVAGTEPDLCGTVTDIYIGAKEKKYIGHKAFGHIIEADTLDECFFATTKKLIEQIKFDEKICNDWHLYAPYICIENRLKGNKNYILPLEVWHKSDASSMSYKFYTTLLNMVKKYKNTSIKIINTTCTFMVINYLAKIKCYRSILKYWIKK